MSRVFVLLYIWSQPPRQWDTVPLIFFLLFELHYFQRAFIFPFLLKGKSKMPLSIMAMGILFNTINGYIQGEWIFFLAPEDMYTIDWLTTPQFIIGTIIFFIGMGINFNSDHVIRNLRAPGDTKHFAEKYVPLCNVCQLFW